MRLAPLAATLLFVVAVVLYAWLLAGRRGGPAAPQPADADGHRD